MQPLLAGIPPVLLLCIGHFFHFALVGIIYCNFQANYFKKVKNSKINFTAFKA
jgi:hypothetical protein